VIFLFWIFVAAAIVQLGYYLFLFARFAWGRESYYSSDALLPVSVVICARNEAENLSRNLKTILIQNYPEFEVIVVNDQSTDGTMEVLADFASRNEHIRIMQVPAYEDQSLGKKAAIKIGIDQARYDTIVVTDADCHPASTHWLRHIMGSYLSDSTFVLGYSPFIPESGLLHRLMRYENVMTAMQYFSFARAGMPYMGVGRNMSFRRSVFVDWEGYDPSQIIAGGDDDLFVNAQARGNHTTICLHRDALVYTAAPSGLGAWLRQKTRHVSSSFYYQRKHKFLLFLFALSNFLLYALLPVQFILPSMGLLASGLFGLVWMTKYLVTERVNEKLHQGGLTDWLPILDTLYVLYLLLIFLITLTRPKQAWK
jgi:poly-beta-1,6-N-acetyl-D-glucosamine synthase